MHLYNDDGDVINGLVCTDCDYVRYLSVPIRLPELEPSRDPETGGGAR